MTEPRLVGDRYALDGVIGRGGMAEVYRARDIRLDRQVAVKTLRADLARDPTFQTRFRREAQSAASLNHPAIVAVYDTGEDIINGASVPYIVMEYVEGRTLRDLLREDRRLLPERAVEITDGILRALDYSHRGGIVHRDIKPANVMLTPSGDVKVMDFGIARAVADTTSTVTQTAQVIGTAQYLSPEQARGERVDARSDIYSTGCVLYELLTGSPPFTGDSPVSIAYQHVREDPVPPSQLDPEIPTWADAIVLKAMTKSADDRYQSAAQMRTDIQRALIGQPVEAPLALAGATQRFTTHPGATQGLPTAVGYEDEVDRGGHRRAGQRSPRWPWILLIVLLVLGGAALAGWMLSGGGGAAEGPQLVSVPNVVGITQQAADRKLRDAGLVPKVTREFNSEQPKGYVFAQNPRTGTRADRGSTVQLSVSKGSSDIQVPNDLIGKSKNDAADELKSAGLKVGDVKEQTSDADKDEVLSTDPGGGTSVERGSEVDLIVSSGPVEVPDVVGKSYEDAYALLRDDGFDVQARQRPVASPDSDGMVVAQNPDAGTEVEPGSTVVLFVGHSTQQSPPSQSPGDGGNGGGDNNGNGNGGGDDGGDDGGGGLFGGGGP